MANFRIKVEPLNPDVEVDEELMNGMECDGFFLVGHTELTATESEDTISINEMSPIDMAVAIAKSTELLDAAIIAKGIDDARQMRKNRESRNGAALLAKLFNDLQRRAAYATGDMCWGCCWPWAWRPG